MSENAATSPRREATAAPDAETHATAATTTTTARAATAATAALATPQIALRRVRPEADSDIPTPRYMTPGAAGADLFAAVSEPLVITPLARVAVPTGFAMAIPRGWEGQIRARSGNALRYGLTVVNAPGTIDSDYRGEVAVLMVNLGREPVIIRRGERVAQLVVAPCAQARFVEVDALSDSERGEGGFGSTGR
jgi:dUTP pyrophosphatase